MGYSARRFGILFHGNVLTSGKETILGPDVHESVSARVPVKHFKVLISRLQ